MKTAILLSGHMRTYSTCFYTQRWHVYRHFPGADFYVSTINDDDVDSIKLIPDLVRWDIVDSQPELPEPEELVRFEPYARSVPVQAVLRQLWQLERVWNLSQESGIKYDQYIRMRPDSYFHSFDHWKLVTGAHVPWWGKFGGINDRFALLGPGAAQTYFTTFSQIPKLLEIGCPLHPESLIFGALQTGGELIDDTLRAEFSTLKREGNRPPEISPIDMAHARLR